MPTAQKAVTIGELRKLLEDSQVSVVADYRGLTVAQLGQLRRNLRGKAEFHITKNTLLIRAAQEANLPQFTELLGGPTAVAFVKDDIGGAIQALNDFVRTSRILTLRGALFGPSIVQADKVADLAHVPSRPQLYSQIVGSVQGPLNNLVGTLNQVFSQVVYALQAYSDKQGEGAPAEASTTEVAPAEAPTAEVAPAEAPTETEASPDTAEVETAEAPTAEAETETAAVAPAGEPTAEAEGSAETTNEPPAETAEAPTETTEVSAEAEATEPTTAS